MIRRRWFNPGAKWHGVAFATGLLLAVTLGLLPLQALARGGGGGGHGGSGGGGHGGSGGGHGGGHSQGSSGGHAYSANDQRSNSLNPNNAAYRASQNNRANQLNPNNDAYWSSRGLTRPEGMRSAGDEAQQPEAYEGVSHSADELDASPAEPPGSAPAGMGLANAPVLGAPSNTPPAPSSASTGAESGDAQGFHPVMRILGEFVLAGIGFLSAVYLLLVAFVRSRRIRF